jgi:sodium transport system permease protein
MLERTPQHRTGPLWPVFTVLRKEFRENLRDRRTVISALLFGPLFVPALFAAMLAFTMRHGVAASDAPLEVAVAHGERAPNLVSQLVEYGITVVPTALDDAGARAAVRSGRYKQVLLIPADYARQMAAGFPAPLRLYEDSSDRLSEPNVARLQRLLAGYDSKLARLRLLARGVDPLTLSALALQDVDVATPASRSVLALGALSYLIVLTMLTGGLYVAIDATAGERERGSLEALLTLPVRREQLIYGKILAACAFMLISLSLTVAALAIGLHLVGLERLGMSVHFGPVTALAAIGCCAPLAPLGAALMTLVAAVTRSYREAQTYLGLTLLVPTLPLIFAGIAGLKPSAGLMLVPSLSQHFLITKLLRAESIPAPYLALSVIATLALGALLTLAAGRLYRRESLLG